MGKNNKKIFKVIILLLSFAVLIPLTFAAEEAPPPPPSFPGEEEAKIIISDIPSWPKGIIAKFGPTSTDKEELLADLNADSTLALGTIKLILPSGIDVSIGSPEYEKWKANGFKGEPEVKKKEEKKKNEPTPGPTPVQTPESGEKKKPIQAGDEEKTFIIAIKSVKSRLNQLSDSKIRLKDKIEALEEIKEKFTIINKKNFQDLVSKLAIDLPEEINTLEKIKKFIATNEEKIGKEKEQQDEQDFKSNLEQLIKKSEHIKKTTDLKTKDQFLKEIKNIFKNINVNEFSKLVTKLNIQLPAHASDVEAIKKFIADTQENIDNQKKLKALEQAKKLIPKVKQDIATLINTPVFQKEKLEPMDKQALSTYLKNINDKLKSIQNVIDDTFYVNLEPKLGIKDKASFNNWLETQAKKKSKQQGLVVDGGMMDELKKALLGKGDKGDQELRNKIENLVSLSNQLNALEKR